MKKAISTYINKYKKEYEKELENKKNEWRKDSIINYDVGHKEIEHIRGTLYKMKGYSGDTIYMHVDKRIIITDNYVIFVTN